MRRLFERVVFVLCLAYVLPLAGYLLFRGIPSTAPWWLDLANTFTLYLFIPAVPAVLLGLLSLSRPTLLLSIVPIVFFVFLYGGLFVPRHPDSAAGATVFTVMTHNVDAGHPSSEGVAQVVTEVGPDVVALQELTPNAAEALTARLGREYPYQYLLPRADYSGVGVLSRFPIVTKEPLAVGHLGQHLVLDVHGQDVHVFNVHPLAPEVHWVKGQSLLPYMIRDFNTETQTQQAAAIVEKVDAARGPIVVMGDFNMTDQSRQYGRITQGLIDAYREVGWGFGHTFPANGAFRSLPLPLIRIDYIFHSRELTGLDARVGDSTGSDHLPVIARLSLDPSK